MKTLRIKLRKEWSENAPGTIMEPAVSLAKILIAEGYAAPYKGRMVETTTAPPAPENAMDALRPGRRRRGKGDKP